MARVIVQESVCLGKKFFDGKMVFADVKDMIKKIKNVDGRISVSKSTHRLTCTQNIHKVSFQKDGISYEIHLTEKQFEQMLPSFKEMGEIHINKYFWWYNRNRL